MSVNTLKSVPTAEHDHSAGSCRLCGAGLKHTLVDLGKSADGYVRLWHTADGKTVVLAELAINLLLLGLQVLTAVAMLNKMKRFPALFTWLWIAALVLPLVDMLMVISYFPQAPGSGSARS